MEETLDAFKEKAIESYFMKKFQNILGVRITKDFFDETNTDFFMISFAFRINKEVIYTSLVSISLKLPMQQLPI